MPARFFDLSSPRDMLEKAKREYGRMKSDLSIDTVFNFFVTAYHVKDYVKAKNKVDNVAMQQMYADHDFQMCKFLCHKGKHLTLTRMPDHDTNTVRTGGAMFGAAVLGGAYYGEGPSYRFFVDKRAVDIVALGERLLANWESFFTKNGID